MKNKVMLSLPSGRKVKCPKCAGTNFYSGKYGQTACEECIDGYILLKERNKRRKEKRNGHK